MISDFLPNNRPAAADTRDASLSPASGRIRAWRQATPTETAAAFFLPRGSFARALRRERGLAGAPGYDLSRHIALARRLRQAQPAASPRNRSANPS